MRLLANHFKLFTRKFTLHANSLLFENVGFVANRLHLNSYQASMAAAVIYHTYFQLCDDDPDTTLHINSGKKMKAVKVSLRQHVPIKLSSPSHNHLFAFQIISWGFRYVCVPVF